MINQLGERKVYHIRKLEETIKKNKHVIRTAKRPHLRDQARMRNKILYRKIQEIKNNLKEK